MPFKVILVNKASVDDDTLAVTRTTLSGYYNKIASAAGATFGGISVVTSSASLGTKDMLCYIVASVDNSVINGNYATVTGGGNVTGNTACSTDIQESASEVYVDIATKNADNLGRMLANIIFHELMHNKECADDDRVHADGGGGLAGEGGIKDITDINQDNINFMKSRITKEVKQWKGGF